VNLAYLKVKRSKVKVTRLIALTDNARYAGQEHYNVLKISLFTKNDDLLVQSFKLHIVVLQLADVDGEVWRQLRR